MTFTLRDYQERTREKVNKCLDAGGNPLIVMDTGTGKTKTDCAIIADRVAKGKRVYVICPGVEIYDQWLNELSFLNPGFINSKDGMKGKNRSVYVCMMKTLDNMLSIIPESLYPDEVHIDEAHRAACDTDVHIFDFFSKAQRLGMTATPLRYDNKPLGDFFSEIINEINIKQAFKNKFLTKYFYVGAEERIDLIPADDDEEIDSRKQAEILGTPQIIGKALEVYEQYGDGKPWIVPCCTHEHATKVRKEFEDAGWIAEHLHGKLPDHERARIVKSARMMKLNIITTVGVGVEGMDIPGLFGILWLRLTRSLTIWKQFNGRVLRLMLGKEWAVIADLAGNAIIHGMPDRIYKWFLDKGPEADDEDKVPFIKCWSCGTYNNPDNLECHWCGAEISFSSEFRPICRYCSNWSKKELSCSVDEDFELYQKEEGCPGFKKRTRSLPAIIDGKLVAITTDGQLHDIKQRAEEKKEEQQLRLKLEEEKRNKPEKITAFEKRKALSKGLFASGMRRSLLQDALSEWE